MKHSHTPNYILMLGALTPESMNRLRMRSMTGSSTFRQTSNRNHKVPSFKPGIPFRQLLASNQILSHILSSEAIVRVLSKSNSVGLLATAFGGIISPGSSKNRVIEACGPKFDQGRVYPLAVECIGAVIDLNGVTQVVVELPIPCLVAREIVGDDRFTRTRQQQAVIRVSDA